MTMAEWTRDMVEERIAEAAAVLRKLPGPRVSGYFNAWPEIQRSAKEIAAMEPEPMRVLPSTSAITRLERTFDWMLWISVEERKLIWLRAARVPWKAITWEFGCDRTTAWRRWTLALTKIASRLNAH